MEKRIDQLSKNISKMYGKKFEPSDAITRYFDLIFDDKGLLVLATEKAEVIERDMELCGYYVIVTSTKMTAKDALTLYKSRDVSEKLFRGDKSYLETEACGYALINRLVPKSL